MQCAQGYSGCIGVSINGSQDGIALGGIIAINVAVADRGDRAPEAVVVLGVEDSDQRIVHALGDCRKEPGIAR